MVIAFAYFLFMVPFQVALNYDLDTTWLYCLDILFSIVFIMDIFMRSRQAFLIHDRDMIEIVLDLDQV